MRVHTTIKPGLGFDDGMVKLDALLSQTGSIMVPLAAPDGKKTAAVDIPKGICPGIAITIQKTLEQNRSEVIARAWYGRFISVS